MGEIRQLGRLHFPQPQIGLVSPLPIFGSAERADAELIPLGIGHRDSPAGTWLTGLGPSKRYDLANRSIYVGNQEVKVASVLDGFIFGNLLQHEECSWAEGADSYPGAFAPEWARMVADQCAPKGCLPVYVDYVQNDSAIFPDYTLEHLWYNTGLGDDHGRSPPTLYPLASDRIG